MGTPITLQYGQLQNLARPPAVADPYLAFGSATLTVSPNSGAAIAQGESLLWCPVDANGGSPNDPTPHPRSEGREQRIIGGASGDWDITTGTHWQSGVLRVTRFCSPLNGTGQSRTVWNQVHGKVPSTGLPIISVIRKATPGSSTVELYNIVRTTPASGAPVQQSASISIPVGASYAYDCRIVNGLLTLRVAHPVPAVPVGDVFPFGADPGNVQVLHSYQFDGTWAGGTNYFKAGNYIQDDTTTHTGGIEVIYQRLEWGHS
ncbi:polysaccharide lyase family 7 protein [Nevskia ramosa]|uniref:polysaccharide lyase family 7 protein n=1 Tax=Nevskia ramosa TaxID=64002 RepID=UPI00146A10F8|nr:polysaccharide lyase family 7 protein [Nevskia ramosa]